MKDVALITLHGMGKVDWHYHSELENRLRNDLGADWERVSFKVVNYAYFLQQPQNILWERMLRDTDNELDATRLRKFLLFGFGDAAALEYSARQAGPNTKYLQVQREIQAQLSQAFEELGRDHRKPVVIIAQSLGCQVISSYLWDAGTGKYIFESMAGIDAGEREFVKLRSLRNLVTTGCNIPIFASGLDRPTCFDRPNPQFQWDNYYDADDVLGWPMNQLGNTYHFVRDHPINAGNLLTSWNPLSHTGYWSDDDVLLPLAEKLRQLLTATT
ncbi:hypothetical protein [uncultured Microbulbifer sp.]|uniref:hypothetical protein n=1 Tax=uncultured Microbulbifer sp. TaxID=348147 RepID=UPI002601FA93|nr:hypothetical protein [uncultured Microbulbifer sp.]